LLQAVNLLLPASVWDMALPINKKIWTNKAIQFIQLSFALLNTLYLLRIYLL
jgi:predicted acyltransferase